MSDAQRALMALELADILDDLAARLGDEGSFDRVLATALGLRGEPRLVREQMWSAFAGLAAQGLVVPQVVGEHTRGG